MVRRPDDGGPAPFGHEALQLGVDALVVVAHHVGGRSGAPRRHRGRLGERDHRLGRQVGEGPVDGGLVAVVVEALGRATGGQGDRSVVVDDERLGQAGPSLVGDRGESRVVAACGGAGLVFVDAERGEVHELSHCGWAPASVMTAPP